MKNSCLKFYTCTFVMIAITSCKTSTVDPAAATNNTTSGITTNLTSGTWVVGSFTQKTEDKTSKFSGYSFVFSADGKVTVSKDGKQTSGTWQYTPAVTYYGATSKEAIDLSVGNDKPLSQLSRKWNFISTTATAIKVDNPEILEDEHLLLSKK